MIYLKQKEGNCISMHGDTLDAGHQVDALPRVFWRKSCVFRFTYLAGVASVLTPCGYVLVLQLVILRCVLGPDTLWLCVDITAYCSQFGLGQQGWLWSDVHATQGPCRRFDAFVSINHTFMVLHQVLVSRPITALRLHCLNGRLQFMGGPRQALAADARRVRNDVRGP